LSSYNTKKLYLYSF